MFDHSGSGDFILDRLIKDINGKLTSNKINIIRERKEIKYAEELLSHFKKSLEEKNKDLNIIIEEGDRLEKEISKFQCNKTTVNNQIICIRTGDQTDIERLFLKRKNADIVDNGVCNIVATRNEDSSSDKSRDMSIYIHSLLKKEIVLKQLQLPSLKNVTVYSILTRYDFGVFVGGSDGFLMRYFNNEEHIYETNVNEDIIQIESMMLSKVMLLVACTKTKILVFKEITDFISFRSIDLSVISSVYNDGTLLYITLESGVIKRINKTNWIICEYGDNKASKNCVLFPCSINNKYFLVTLKDRLLYKTKNKDLSVLLEIEGISNIRNVLKLKNSNILCYSVDIIWILNKNCEIVDTIPFKNGIKFVDRNKECGVVVDGKDFVHIYPLVKEGIFGDKVFEKEVEGEITALSLNNDGVYVAMRDEILIFNFACL